MKTKTSLTIPKNKINGEIVRQLIYGAIKDYWTKLNDKQIIDCLKELVAEAKEELEEEKK